MAEKDQHEAPKAAGPCVPSERAEPLSALVPQLVPLELMSKEEAVRPSLACRSLGSLVRLRRGILEMHYYPYLSLSSVLGLLRSGAGKTRNVGPRIHR